MATISEILSGLAACLCAQITEDDSPETCFCGVIPGGGVVADYAGDCDDVNGMAWVRLITSYPAQSVGQALQQVGNCSVGVGIDVEIGMLRRYPLDAEALDEATLLELVDQQIKDMHTMRKAVQCCAGNSFGNKDYILGSYTPVGPDGDLVGGTWTLYLML